jgi:hypothetical protein
MRSIRFSFLKILKVRYSIDATLSSKILMVVTEENLSQLDPQSMCLDFLAEVLVCSSSIKQWQDYTLVGLD